MDPEPMEDKAGKLFQELLERLDEDPGFDLESFLKAHPRQATELEARLGIADDSANAGSSMAGQGLTERLHAFFGVGPESPSAPGTAGSTSRPAKPDRIGRYRILDVLGEGGMGTVYLAEQREPLHRKVALKLVKLGMDTKDVVVRFEAERQVLALMNHANIAQVFDAGSTEDGRPFFVMEHVPGLPITTYCDTQKLGLDKRLRLFIEVCRGIQHAHQKGIIHRDIKPSNILVLLQDGRPTPKIIDFGVAKATHQRLTEHTLFTEQGRIIGTPEYMSPEQAEMSGLDVDTRSDIYSMGVILYELLTSRPPFDSSELRGAGYVKLLYTIREENPRTPSSRLRTLGDASEPVARKRRTDPASLVRRIRGDLDWITMKALEKDPTRRYQTSSELAADLERHLDHEPVEAGPPSTLYRMSKFGRKYKVQVASTAAVFLALLAGLVASWLFFLEARGNEVLAVSKAEEAKKAREREACARRAAEDSLADFNLLANVVKLREAREEEEKLYPAWPEQTTAMQRWLEERGEPLARQLPVIRKALFELRASALGAAEARRIEEIEKKSPGGQTYAIDFQDDAKELLHNTLRKLIGELEAFVDPDEGEVAQVKDRLAWARSVKRKTIDDFRKGWDEAIAAIRASDGVRASKLYRGLRLTAKLGLVPLGPDPRSKLWEFAHPRSGTIPERDPKTSLLEFTGESGLVFVLLPGGSFHMGTQNKDPTKPNYDPDAIPADGPVVEVRLAPFFLSKYEMTQAQWKRITGSNPSRYPAGTRSGGIEVSPLHPVENLKWDDCHLVLFRLGLTLPTEAQWEYSCRAGTSTIWHTGNDVSSLAGYANIADEPSAKYWFPNWAYEKGFRDGYASHAPIGSFQPNSFGLYDMHGNVMEFVKDWNAKYTVPPGPLDGERHIREGARRLHLARGGTFNYPASVTRSAHRAGLLPDVQSFHIGLRPARAN